MHWLTYVENPGIALAPGFRPSGEGAQLTLNRSSWLGNALIGLSQSWRGSQLLQKLDDKEGVPKEKWGDQKADESLLSGQAQMSTTKARREPRPGQDAEDPSFCFTAAPRGHRAGMPILVSTVRLPGRPQLCLRPWGRPSVGVTSALDSGEVQGAGAGPGLL